MLRCQQFISMINVTSEIESKKNLYFFQQLSFYEQLIFHPHFELSMKTSGPGIPECTGCFGPSLSSTLYLVWYFHFILSILGLCLLDNFALFCRLMLFSKSTFMKNYFRNTIRVSNSLEPDQARHFVGPDLGPNCL